MKPLVTVTIETDLTEITDFGTNVSDEDSSDTTATGDIVTTNKLVSNAGTYTLHTKFETPEPQLRMVLDAIRTAKNPFLELLPDEIKNDYFINRDTLSISVSAAQPIVVAAACVRRQDSHRDQSLFTELRNIEASPGYLDPHQLIDWFYDYGDDSLESMTTDEAVEWLTNRD